MSIDKVANGLLYADIDKGERRTRRSQLYKVSRMDYMILQNDDNNTNK